MFDCLSRNHQKRFLISPPPSPPQLFLAFVQILTSASPRDGRSLVFTCETTRAWGCDDEDKRRRLGIECHAALRPCWKRIPVISLRHLRRNPTMRRRSCSLRAFVGAATWNFQGCFHCSKGEKYSGAQRSSLSMVRLLCLVHLLCAVQLPAETLIKFISS